MKNPFKSFRNFFLLLSRHPFVALALLIPSPSGTVKKKRNEGSEAPGNKAVHYYRPNQPNEKGCPPAVAGTVFTLERSPQKKHQQPYSLSPDSRPSLGPRLGPRSSG